MFEKKLNWEEVGKREAQLKKKFLKLFGEMKKFVIFDEIEKYLIHFEFQLREKEVKIL